MYNFELIWRIFHRLSMEVKLISETRCYLTIFCFSPFVQTWVITTWCIMSCISCLFKIYSNASSVSRLTMLLKILWSADAIFFFYGYLLFWKFLWLAFCKSEFFFLEVCSTFLKWYSFFVVGHILKCLYSSDF